MTTDLPFFVADNQCITRAGMHHYLREIFGQCRIADIENKKELIDHCKRYGKGIVILDYSLFDLYGIEDLLVIGKRFPDVYWLLFSNDLSNDFLRRLSIEPHVGIIFKECSDEEIRRALRSAAEKKPFHGAEIINRLAAEKDTPEEKTLTASETEILKLIAHGKSVKEIAAVRNSSIHTITTHKKNLFRKLGVNTSYEATKYALRAGLVELAEYYI